MNTLDYLDSLAQETASSRGLSVPHARTLVRLAMVNIAIQLGIPCERIIDYLETLGADVCTSKAVAS